MEKSTWDLGRVWGIPIRIHISWALIFVIVTWSLAGGYFPERYPDWQTWLYWSMGLLTSVLFFASVLLHELAHSLVARYKGIPVRDITLFIFGGVAQIEDEPESAETEFLIALAGPLTSFLLAGLFALFWLLVRWISPPLGAMGLYLAGINASLGIFNLIPGFPLDGGRILRAILWSAGRNLERATRWASLVGQGVAYLFILVGIWQVFTGHWLNGLWLVFIGWFLDNAAQTTYRQVALRRLLKRHTVAEAMTTECHPLDASTVLDELIHQHIVGTGRRCFPVIKDGRIKGLVSIHRIKRIPRNRWGQTTIEEIMIPLGHLKVIGPADGLWAAFQEMSEEGVNQLPVMEGERLIGMLARDNLISFLRLMAELEA